jgi:hypothetical protein
MTLHVLNHLPAISHSHLQAVLESEIVTVGRHTHAATLEPCITSELDKFAIKCQSTCLLPGVGQLGSKLAPPMQQKMAVVCNIAENIILNPTETPWTPSKAFPVDR